MLNAVFGPSFQLIKCPAILGDTNDWDVELAAFSQLLQCRENFLMRKVAGGAQKYEGI